MVIFAVFVSEIYQLKSTHNTKARTWGWMNTTAGHVGINLKLGVSLSPLMRALTAD